MVPQHFILCWSWVIADMQSANCKPNRATIVTRMSSCVLIAQIDSKRIRRLSQRKDTEIIRVATAGCLSFLTIRRYNVFMSGAQESLLDSRVETILAGEIADGDLRVGGPTSDGRQPYWAIRGQPHYRPAGDSESCEPRPGRRSRRSLHWPDFSAILSSGQIGSRAIVCVVEP